MAGIDAAGGAGLGWRLQGRAIAKGVASGELLLTLEPISFYGGVDAASGAVVEAGHPLQGKSVAGKVLAFPNGKGSTVGSYVLYRLAKNGHAPLALVCKEAEAIVATGAIMAGIPMVDRIDFGRLKNGAMVSVNGSLGTVDILP